MDYQKPLGHKSYGSIGHLSGSRLGPSDSCVNPGQERIATQKPRDRKDLVIVQEKLDGSNCTVARLNGQILALGRAGHLAQSSPYEQHQKFAAWVRQHESRFSALLRDGERVCGEWLLQAHGTRYKLPHEPFVPFDIFTDHTTRIVYHDFLHRVLPFGFTVPRLIHLGHPVPVKHVLKLLEPSGHGAIDPVEGAVWRVEREGRVDFLCKYVRPDKVDGIYLDQQVWNESL